MAYTGNVFFGFFLPLSCGLSCMVVTWKVNTPVGMSCVDLREKEKVFYISVEEGESNFLYLFFLV
jgi:hypothetical protein